MADLHGHIHQTVMIPETAGLGVSGNISISCYQHQAIRELFAHVT